METLYELVYGGFAPMAIPAAPSVAAIWPYTLLPTEPYRLMFLYQKIFFAKSCLELCVVWKLKGNWYKWNIFLPNENDWLQL